MLYYLIFIILYYIILYYIISYYITSYYIIFHSILFYSFLLYFMLLRCGGEGEHVGSLAGRLIGKHGGAGWRASRQGAGVHVSRRPTWRLRGGAGREAGGEANRKAEDGKHGPLPPRAPPTKGGNVSLQNEYYRR